MSDENGLGGCGLGGTGLRWRYWLLIYISGDSQPVAVAASVVKGGDSDRVADPDWIRIQSGQWIQDPDPGGQKLPTKVEIFFKSSCFEVLDGLF